MNNIIANNEKENKFYIRLDGKEAFLKYSFKEGNIIDFQSTYVPQEFRGKDIGEAIVKEAFAYAAEKNLKVIPTCSFVQSLVKHNKEYQKLIA
jgi:uncharacterized protein